VGRVWPPKLGQWHHWPQPAWHRTRHRGTWRGHRNLSDLRSGES